MAGLFLARWIKAPHLIGAIAPSSRHLARAMARQIDPHATSCVVELGGGTGSITRALLDSGLPPEKLIVVERDPALYLLLKTRFPGVRILRGDAARLRALLEPFGIRRVSAIVSSLPLLSLPRRQCRRIIEESLALLGERGTFVQYTYGVLSPLHRRDFGLEGTVAQRVWRNLPPAAVWRFNRRAGIGAIAAPA